jgi:formate hydrogenlyase transcriptional activator
VLIEGESGAGKELIARAIHNRSPRASQPFIKVSCAALPEPLLESELFGHEKGAFTGAIATRKGRFELADNGTLFLDEIGEITPAVQVKLLRAIQEREFERVGGSRTIKSDTRIISATNKNLLQEIRRGAFREDLYYRLNVISIHVPPLRERPEDVPLLAYHFLKNCSAEMNKDVASISDEALATLAGYAWPGNVRELQNVIERAVILSRGPTLEVPLADLQARAAPATPAATAASVTLTDAEREHILRALRDTNWVLGGPKGSAARLGMKRSTLHWKMKKLGITRPG